MIDLKRRASSDERDAVCTHPQSEYFLLELYNAAVTYGATFFSFVSHTCTCRLKAGLSTKKKFQPKSSSKRELDKFYDMILDRLSRHEAPEN